MKSFLDSFVLDYYKNSMSGNYLVPIINSLFICFLLDFFLFKALDKSYGLYKQKSLNQNAKKVDLSTFDAFLFHTPYCKLGKSNKILELQLQIWRQNSCARQKRKKNLIPTNFLSIVNYSL